MATLLLELALTRIFSVVFYYHFAFLAISIALFGLGLGGVFSYVVAGWKGPLFARLGRLSLINSLLVILALAILLAQGDNLSNWDLALVYFTTALPFFVAGAIVSLAISETIEHVDRIYFFDLAGAAAGCFLLLAMVRLVGGPDTVIGAAVTFAVAAAIWHSLAGFEKRARGQRGGGARAGRLPGLQPEASRADDPACQGAGAPGGGLQAVERPFADRRGAADGPGGDYNIVIDADAATDDRALRFRSPHGRESPRPDVPGAGAALCRSAGGEDVDHRTGRRVGCGARHRRRQQRCHGGGDQPDHRAHRDAAALREIQQRSVLAARGPPGGGGRAQFRAAQHQQVPGDSGDAGGHLGGDGGRRVRALGEQSLYQRRFPRLPDAPDRRWRAGDHALGLRAAARIAAPDFAGDRRADATGREGAVAPRDRFAAGVRWKGTARWIRCWWRASR